MTECVWVMCVRDCAVSVCVLGVWGVCVSVCASRVCVRVVCAYRVWAFVGSLSCVCVNFVCVSTSCVCLCSVCVCASCVRTCVCVCVYLRTCVRHGCVCVISVYALVFVCSLSVYNRGVCVRRECVMCLCRCLWVVFASFVSPSCVCA